MVLFSIEMKRLIPQRFWLGNMNQYGFQDIAEHIAKQLLDDLSSPKSFLNFSEEFIFCCAAVTFLKSLYVTLEMINKFFNSLIFLVTPVIMGLLLVFYHVLNIQTGIILFQMVNCLSISYVSWKDADDTSTEHSEKGVIKVSK
ncbi:hypothetical protein NPIL_655161 [Nephila pilipes]|uniref:Uncharacterized protein n=1 Tax=Nephila pilipes TaxID=299642 RepID=A0A8X6IV56_NEPPI|nr:hypothetical protein NPIL_655161 [Nephila pilipes]